MEITLKRHEEVKDLYNIVTDGQYPALTGTDKQVEWADRIRHDHVTAMVGKLDRLAVNNPDQVEKNMDDLKATMKSIEIIVNDNADAKFWIDNRNSLVAITGRIYKEMR